MHPRDDILSWSDRFLTREEQLVASGTDLAQHADQYYRCDDPLCSLLFRMLMDDKGQFAREFFPFYRKMSVLAFPQIEASFPVWLMLAFASGQVYGGHFPKLADDLFENDRPQAQSAWDMLAALRRRLEGTRITWVKLAKALNDCVGNGCDQKMTKVIECLQTATCAGLLASTTARNDILQMDFLEQVQQSTRPSKLPIHFTAAINGPLVAHGRRALDLMLHPLLDVAFEKYVPTPLEGHVILKYLNQELHRFNSKGEQECPVDSRNLVKWIADAMTYARTLADTDGDLLAKVFVETGQSQLRVVLKILQEVSFGIEENSPQCITDVILRWHESMFGWREPEYYGQALERIVHCVDMAIWLVWAPELSDFPDVSSKRGMAM
ncbi:MAG TPA: hypothetical protein VGY56_18315 [Verrucomicrobiae bacterium]|nr:hypothetical protein [Verrucomicrobiae bacterium]